MARNGAFIIRFELSLIFTTKLSTAKKKWPIGHLQAVEKKVSRAKNSVNIHYGACKNK